MKHCLAAFALLLVSCSPPPPVPAGPSAPSASGTPSSDSVEAPRLAVPSDKRVLQTLSTNLDLDAAEEQIVLLQNKANLSLPVQIQVADFDLARKTYYLAWEGTALAAASQPMTLDLDDLIGDHQNEVILQGLDESGKATLDVLRFVPPTGSLGFAYRTVLSRVSAGTIQIERPLRPESYSAGQNSELSATIVTDEPDPASRDSRDTLRTTYTWLFQRGEYVATGVERYRRDITADAALEKLFSSDNAALEAFLKGPWVKTVPDKTGMLLLFLDPTEREITFVSTRAEEVYHWETTSRSSRGSLYLVGSNDLINLIKLQMSLAITSSDGIEVNAIDNPAWSGSYRKLDASAARALARQGSAALVQQAPPVGVYKNDKGDEFDFQAPEVRMSLGGAVMVGSVAMYPLGGVTVLQIKVPARPGSPGFSKAYSLVSKEESSTSRVVRTLSLQGGTLTSKGWVSDQTDALRLEQVETAVSR